MSDELPKKIKEFEKSIIILDSSTGFATYWVCYYNDTKQKYTEYFDPFAEYKYDETQCNARKLVKDYIPKNIKIFLKKLNKKTHIAHNDSFIQNPTSIKCG